MVSHAQANQQTLVKLLVVAVAMFGFGYAMVPFYRAICDALGLNGVVKADAAANTQVDTGRLLTVEFDANLRSNLPWTFTPLEKSVRVHPGALTQVVYEVRNQSDRPVTGQAIPSFGPQLAGRYFKKLECFCFTQQTLAPGEVRRMPVAFVIERELPQDIGTVTLSYTFFEVEGEGAQEPGLMIVSEPVEAPRKATPLQVAKAVASAFIGIRRRAAHERDVVTITPVQAIVAGLIGAALFVASLLLLVSVVTG